MRWCGSTKGACTTCATGMLGDADSAADAGQDAFVSAFRNMRKFRGGSFRSWMLRIATNTCYDVLRARKRRPTTSLNANPQNDEDPPALQIADKGETPDERVQRRELATAIQHALASLPEDQRIVVVLSDVEGLSYDEIAQITGTNLGTVKSRLSRGGRACAMHSKRGNSCRLVFVMKTVNKSKPEIHAAPAAQVAS